MAFEAVESTNARALEAALAGDPGPLWVTAERQTSGRGRRGRAWASPSGNLYASLLLLDPAPRELLGNLPLVVAVGVRAGLASLPGVADERVRIKWPNDVLVGGGKCVGILIESESLGAGANAVVIGCGVNVASAPLGAPYTVSSLQGEGSRASVDDVFEHLASGVEEALRRWDRGRGFEAIRRDWIAHAIGIGEACTANLTTRSIEGRFIELDKDGRLVLETGDGIREAISAGDVFFEANRVP
ncbi:biotin--[acetyl-CoA-carboxylase] ligase [Aureimonas populi]|uniref:biotin--[biotin carboxyl-carrier protein] ligase n=1 Tax=Aureimonas populi TaxID=1701758 RepID=A0ABW5CIF5_9HYPH|nr:biotin--[acetyl-CoA-carboxylase] ligase [Aureimonas populi]